MDSRIRVKQPHDSSERVKMAKVSLSKTVGGREPKPKMASEGQKSEQLVGETAGARLRVKRWG